MNLLNKNNIIIAVSALVVLGAGTYFYQQSCEQKEQASKSALFQVEKTLQTESATLTEAEKTPGAKIDVDAKFPKTIAELNKLVSGSDTPQVKFEAGMKLGAMYLGYANDASFSKAIEAFKKVTEFGKTSFQKASAFYLLGSTQEKANLVKEAADSFQKALDQGNEGMKNEVLLSLVRVNVKANNATQAKNFADKLNKESPGSKAAQEAQKLISSKS